MNLGKKIRALATAALVVLCVGLAANVFAADRKRGNANKAVVGPRARPSAAGTQGLQTGPTASESAPQKTLKERLARWRSLSPDQRQKLLERYREFHKLPPEVRRRIQKQLARWEKMPPEEKKQIRRRLQCFKKLGAEERQKLRRRLMAWRAMPEERRLFIRRVLAVLKEVPPEKIKELKKLPPEKRRAELLRYLKSKGITVAPSPWRKRKEAGSVESSRAGENRPRKPSRSWNAHGDKERTRAGRHAGDGGDS